MIKNIARFSGRFFLLLFSFDILALSFFFSFGALPYADTKYPLTYVAESCMNVVDTSIPRVVSDCEDPADVMNANPVYQQDYPNVPSYKSLSNHDDHYYDTVNNPQYP